MGEGRLADTGRADEHQAFAGRPGGLLPGTPDRLGVGGLGDEVPAVGQVAGQPTGAGSEGSLALGAQVGLGGAAYLVWIGAWLAGALVLAQGGFAQAPQVRLAPDDVGVIGGAAGRGRGADELMQVDGAADPAELPGPGEVLG
ncbi:hypothetical protein Srufu_036070 [Streptomyces libani subsp. rufus]|nr:hypothetical protein Srufu_036070 [Streptomyces libani subsp. rufus]